MVAQHHLGPSRDRFSWSRMTAGEPVTPVTPFGRWGRGRREESVLLAEVFLSWFMDLAPHKGSVDLTIWLKLIFIAMVFHFLHPETF